MFRDPILTDEQNAGNQKAVQRRMEDTVRELKEEQTDAEFTMKLLDLCLLNRANDSYYVEK